MRKSKVNLKELKIIKLKNTSDAQALIGFQRNEYNSSFFENPKKFSLNTLTKDTKLNIKLSKKVRNLGIQTKKSKNFKQEFILGSTISVKDNIIKVIVQTKEKSKEIEYTLIPNTKMKDGIYTHTFLVMKDSEILLVLDPSKRRVNGRFLDKKDLRIKKQKLIKRTISKTIRTSNSESAKNAKSVTNPRTLKTNFIADITMFFETLSKKYYNVSKGKTKTNLTLDSTRLLDENQVLDIIIVEFSEVLTPNMLKFIEHLKFK